MSALLTLSELHELLERNRRRDREVDRAIAAIVSVHSAFDQLIEGMRANNYRNYRALDRRSDDEKDADEERQDGWVR